MTGADSGSAERPDDHAPLTGPGASVLEVASRADIVGALGTLKAADTGPRRSWRRRLSALLIIMGPGLIVMGGGNDAAGLSFTPRPARTTAPP